MTTSPWLALYPAYVSRNSAPATGYRLKGFPAREPNADARPISSPSIVQYALDSINLCSIISARPSMEGNRSAAPT